MIVTHSCPAVMTRTPHRLCRGVGGQRLAALQSPVLRLHIGSIRQRGHRLCRRHASEEAVPLLVDERRDSAGEASGGSWGEGPREPGPNLAVADAGGVVVLPNPDLPNQVNPGSALAAGITANNIVTAPSSAAEAAAQLQSAAAAGDDVTVAQEDADRSPTAWELLRFTLPTLAVWIINPMLGIVDTSVVGMRSTTELAALGPGTQMCDGNAYIFTFLAAATTNMLAISFARQDKELAGAILSDALAIAAVLGCLLAAAMYAAAPGYLARLAGPASAALVGPAVTYVRIRCLGLPSALILFVTQAFFLAAMDPLTPLFAAVLAGSTNLVLDLWLCCGLGWGIAGASLATAIAQVVTTTVLVAAMYRPLRRRSLFPGWRVDVRWRLPSLRATLVFIGYAGPICGVLLTKVLIYGVLTAACARLGPVTSAAHHVMISVYMVLCMCGDAVSQAAQSFLPGVVGRPRAAQSLGKRLMTTGLVVGTFNSVLAGAVVVLLPSLFTNSAEVIGVMNSMLPLMCVGLLIHTASMATEGMLLAGRDLLFLVWSYVVNMLLVFAALHGLRNGPIAFTGVGVWWCLLQFQLVRLLMNGARLLNKSSPLRATQPLQNTARA